MERTEREMESEMRRGREREEMERERERETESERRMGEVGRERESERRTVSPLSAARVGQGLHRIGKLRTKAGEPS